VLRNLLVDVELTLALAGCASGPDDGRHSLVEEGGPPRSRSTEPPC
jgi:hypothetical protein